MSDTEVKGTVYGYARVSTLRQDTEMQVDAILKAGVSRENIFVEKVSGKSTDNRPMLKALLEKVSEGDTVLVYKTDRISRSVPDLYKLMDFLKNKGVKYKSITEAEMDTNTQFGKLLFGLIAIMAELERSQINERVIDALIHAKEYGTKSGKPIGRPKKTSKDENDQIIQLYKGGTPVKKIRATFDISKNTLYRILKQGKVPLRYMDNLPTEEVFPESGITSSVAQ